MRRTPASRSPPGAAALACRISTHAPTTGFGVPVEHAVVADEARAAVHIVPSVPGA